MLNFLPDEIFEIDDSNPLTYDIKHGWVIGPDSLDGNVRDLRGLLPGTIMGGAVTQVGQYGRELVCDSASKSIYCGDIGSDFQNQSWTCLVIGYGTGATTVDRMCGYGSDGSTGWSIDWEVYNATNKVGMAQWGVGDVISTVTTPVGMSAVAISRISGKFTAAANGKVSTLTTIGNPTAWSTNPQFRIGSGVRFGGGYTSINGAVKACFLWKRPLSNKELIAVTSNPWQLLRRPYVRADSNMANVLGLVGGTDATATPSGVSATGSIGSLSIVGDTTVSLTGLAGTSAVGTVTAAEFLISYYPLVINPAYLDNSISGDPSFTNFVVIVDWADIVTEFKDGGAISADDGGGNIRVYTSTDLTDASRLALNVEDFDISGGTATLKILVPVLPVSTGITLYIARVAPGSTQPAASDTYGSDAVDVYDPDLVTPPNPSDLKTTYDNQAAEADFAIPGGIQTPTYWTVDLTGVAGTGAIGTLTATGSSATTASPTGVEGTGAVGTLAAATSSSIALTGVYGTGSIGSLAVQGDVSVSPTGVSATGDVGDVVIPNDTTASLTGVYGTGGAGDITINFDSLWTIQTTDNTTWTIQ